MIRNLFSVFDPVSRIISLSLNWLRLFIGLVILPIMYWFFPSRLTSLWVLISLTLHKEFKILLGPGGKVGSTLIFISVFTFIFFNNFYGLFPYIFTCTSHLAVTLVLSLPLWLSFIIYGWVNNMEHIFVHLVPQGTPSVLMSFMVLIETIRNMIRPGTLAVRLTANIIAGHLLITLLGGTGSTMSILIVNLLLLVQMGLLILEFAVALIQSYVFAVLSTLYSREVN